MNLIRRARMSLVAALLGCSCVAMLAGVREKREAAIGGDDGAVAGAGGGTILYVDDDAPLGGDGLTWLTAHRFLQDALDAAREPESGVTEIRVAGGEYKPDQGASVTPGDSFATFWIPAGLTVAGGYAGLLEPDPDVRDWSLYVTTFNGDLLGNDGPLGGFENNTENSIHISRIEPGDAPAHLSGVRFIRSRAVFSPTENRGGAVNCENGRVVIEDCRFEGNRAGEGGAIGVVSGTATIARCAFDLNRSPVGGAMRILYSEVTVVDSSLAHNIGSSGGGAVSCFSGTMTMDACEFRWNSSGSADGGAIKSDHTSIPRLYGCLFEDNDGDYGGAILGPAIAEDCDFISNEAYFAGAIDHGGGAFVLKHCRFVNNFASTSCGAVDAAGGAFVHCVFEGNEAYGERGGAFTGSGTFVNCKFRRNLAWTGGGAASIGYNSAFINSTFVANHSELNGGAILVLAGQTATLANCTLLANTSVGAGAAISGPAQVVSSIIWDHLGAALPQIGSVTFSCVQGSWPGEGNSDADPSLVNALGADGVLGTEDDDLRLSAGSPCIDSGSNAAIPADALDLDDDGDTTEMTPFDLSGGVRRINDPATPDGGNSMGLQTVVDIGALEFRDFKMRVGDANSDGVVNIDDLLEVIGAWGPCPIAPVPCPQDIAPSGGDGEIDISDLLLVIDNWFLN